MLIVNMLDIIRELMILPELPTVYSSEITTYPSVHYFDIIATGTTVTIMLIANNNGVVYFDDVSFRKTDGNSIGGSVHFDGNDHLSIGSAGDFNFLHNGATDWTAEFWAKVPNATRQFVFGTGASSAQIGFSLTIMSSADNQSDATGVYAQFGRGAAGNYRYWGTSSGLVVNTWHHIAAVFKSSDKTLALYIDGIEVDNDTGTANGTFGSGNYSSSNSSYAFIVGKNVHASTFFTGYISNLRVVAGRRLYTSVFTPPVHALEPIDGTRILCCNNSDSQKQNQQERLSHQWRSTINLRQKIQDFLETSHTVQSLGVSQHLIHKVILFHHQVQQNREVMRSWCLVAVILDQLELPLLKV